MKNYFLAIGYWLLFQINSTFRNRKIAAVGSSTRQDCRCQLPLRKESFGLPTLIFGIIITLSITVSFLSSCKEIQPVTMGGVENPRLISLSKEGVEFEFGMKIKNPNNVGVTVFPSSFDGKVNGLDIGKIKLHKRVRIKAKSDESPVFHIKSDFSKIGLADMANILPMLASKRADIALKGKVRVGKWYYKRKFPVELNKTISLSK